MWERIKIKVKIFSHTVLFLPPDFQHQIQNLKSDLERSRSEKADEMANRVQMESKMRVSPWHRQIA